MFSPFLFDHKYDVDDIITALCGNHHSGRWLLNTREGELRQEKAEEKTNIQDGDDENHWHEITPLSTAYISELRTHEKFSLVTDEDKAEILSLLEKRS